MIFVDRFTVKDLSIEDEKLTKRYLYNYHCLNGRDYEIKLHKGMVKFIPIGINKETVANVIDSMISLHAIFK